MAALSPLQASFLSQLSYLPSDFLEAGLTFEQNIQRWKNTPKIQDYFKDPKKASEKIALEQIEKDPTLRNLMIVGKEKASDANMSFQAVAFRDSDGDTHFAFTGTQGVGDKLDVVTDAGVVLSPVPTTQHITTLNFINKYAGNPPHIGTVMGHSLGGNLAKWAALNFAVSNCFSFNAPGFNPLMLLHAKHPDNGYLIDEYNSDLDAVNLPGVNPAGQRVKYVKHASHDILDEHNLYIFWQRDKDGNVNLAPSEQGSLMLKNIVGAGVTIAAYILIFYILKLVIALVLLILPYLIYAVIVALIVYGLYVLGKKIIDIVKKAMAWIDARWQEFRKWLHEIWTSVCKAIAQFANEVKKAILEVWAGIVKTVRQIFERINKWAKSVLSWITRQLELLGNKFAHAVDTSIYIDFGAAREAKNAIVRAQSKLQSAKSSLDSAKRNLGWDPMVLGLRLSIPGGVSSGDLNKSRDYFELSFSEFKSANSRAKNHL